MASRWKFFFLISILFIDRCNGGSVLYRRQDLSSPKRSSKVYSLTQILLENTSQNRKLIKRTGRTKVPACLSKVEYNFYPETAISKNGSVVQVKPMNVEPFTSQHFVVTECVSEHQRCTGSDESFDTYCETWPNWHLTYIRPLGSKEEFKLGQILLPSGCRCLIREKTPSEDRQKWNHKK